MLKQKDLLVIMSKQAEIMCDASFDPNLKLVGYGIEIEVNGSSRRYEGIRSDLRDSTQAEMVAISHGLKMLDKRMKNEGLEVDTLDIYSDSLNGITLLSSDIDGKDPRKVFAEDKLPLRQGILDQIKKLGVEVDFHHVKAHKKKNEASPREARHNEVDAIAYNAMTSYRKTVMKPDKKNSPYYGVVLPVKFKQESSASLFETGRTLASLGYKARYSFDDYTKGAPIDHPFIMGIKSYADANDIALSAITEEMTPIIPGHAKKNDNRFGCNGLDRVLVYELCKQLKTKEGKKSNVDFDTPSAMQAGASSRLLFGKQVAPKLNSQAPFMRREQASGFVLNLSLNRRPYSIGAWASRMSYQIRTPHFNNINQLKQSHVMVAPMISNIVSEVKEQYASLEVDQQVKKIRDICAEGNIQLPSFIHDDRVNKLFASALSCNDDKQILRCKEVLYRPQIMGTELKGESPHTTDTPVNYTAQKTVSRLSPNR
jgi:ribonuclease HI